MLFEKSIYFLTLHNMVLIITDDFEISTNRTIEYLLRYKVPFTRINSDKSKIELISLTLANDSSKDEMILKVDERIVRLSEITAVWQRRGRIRLSSRPAGTYDFLKTVLPRGINKHAEHNLNYEKETLNGYITFFLTQVSRCIGNGNNATQNKLAVLYHAKQLGLLISTSVVTSVKEDVQLAYDSHKPIITKAILDNLFTSTLNDNVAFYTEEIEQETIDALPEKIFYSFLQKKINKKYELRIFYLKGKFYPMAIFSQRDVQTKVDFRKYNQEKPNRTVRYKLPADIEEKLSHLMDILKLDTGSIDMIVNENDEHIFLEVNPVGQYGMVSVPCNYPIEKEIADYLSGQHSQSYPSIN